MSNGSSKDWDEYTTQDWCDDVERWPWHSLAKGQMYQKSGRCYRCNHETVKVLQAGTGPFLREGLGLLGGRLGPVDIACECGGVHPGRPAGRSGCGYAGEFSPPSDLGPRVRPRPQTPDERKWALRAQELHFTELDRLKVTAEKWATSLTAILGAFGAVALIKGPDTIADLEPSLQYWTGGVLALAIACGLISIFLAAFAAQGIPSRQWLTGLGVRERYAEMTEKAAKRLHWSRLVVIPAVLLTGASIGLTWYGKKADRPMPTVIAVQSSGEVVCGVLARDGGGRLVVKSGNQPEVPLAEVVSVATISKCP